jgi:protein SCO1/2
MKRAAHMKKPLSSLLCCLLAVACSEPQPWYNTEVTGALPDLAFRLTGESGETVDAQAFRGQTTLLFFGFTNCPGACPATLGRLSVALDQMGDAAQQVQVLLVSVDPARDTPEAMREYTARFGPWLHGLTGPEADLRALNQAYKVDFSALGAGDDDDYDVIHSNAVFAFDARGRCRLLIRDTANLDAVVSDLQRLVAESDPAGTRG